MKKQLELLLLVCLFFVIFTNPVNAQEINYANGIQNESHINISFDPNSNFNNSEKSEIAAASNSWEQTGIALNMARTPMFYNSSTYNTTDGVSFKKGYISGTPIANCAYNLADSQTVKSSHITFSTNTSYSWTTNIGEANGSEDVWIWDVQSVALHELGHSLGLGHFSNFDAVMYAQMAVYGKRNVTVHDKFYLTQIYDSSSLSASSNYWISQGLTFQPNENHLNLRQSPVEKEKSYDIELGMDIFYPAFDDEQMVNVSDLIVKGRVKEITPSWWNTSDGKAPPIENMLEYSLFHDVIIEVEETFKGNITGKSQEIIIRQAGGTLDNVRQTTSVPQYYEDEEVILYLVEEALSDKTGLKYYTQISEKGQIFIIEENFAVNGLGQEINIQENVVSQIEK
ncbi:matrixin family metalloprotease [Methanolapillus ohkumae]|uniref:Peptidase M10 metallopeptidase domain-containing protein n=1 Tax=Methanolapillus ohkumae TaxID=3028298 RepID=A0AA96ZWA2_9EURY|nr:hypothetical protein MsAm2_16140 [Methanosarcinaceae archaeon Am2]